MTQTFKILKLGIEAGTKGFNSFGEARRIALQLPRVMDDLEKLGVIWRASPPLPDRSVNYTILHVPEELLIQLRKVFKNEAFTQLKEEEFVFVGGTAYRKEDLEPKQESLI